MDCPYFFTFTNNPLPSSSSFRRRLMFGPSRLFIFPLESLLSLCWLEKGKKMRALDVKDQQIMTKIKGNETRPKVRRDHSLPYPYKQLADTTVSLPIAETLQFGYPVYPSL
jgi:hypothetical protein